MQEYSTAYCCWHRKTKWVAPSYDTGISTVKFLGFVTKHASNRQTGGLNFNSLNRVFCAKNEQTSILLYWDLP